MKLRLPLTILAVLALGGGVGYYLAEPGHSHEAEGADTHAHDDHVKAGNGDHAAHEGHTDHDEHDENGESERATIPADVAARSGVVTEIAGPATLAETLSVYGQIKLNGDKVARAVPRFGGIVREARKSLGAPVEAGEVVAVVETNHTLATLEVKAPIAGLIVDRDVTAGETVIEGATLYTIADLSEVWVDLNIPKRDQSRVKIGQAVLVHADDGGTDATALISWISPVSNAEAQTLVARVVLANTRQRWRPGLFVKATVTLSETLVPVAVSESALQSLIERTAVFAKHGDTYEARTVTVGRRGSGRVEILSGLNPGEHYVAENSFLIKADIGKSSASHEH